MTTGVPKINLTYLRNFEILLPSLVVQRKIAAILSAYDDLIENNRRRITLLEKMAEEIYREWFVRMRFPGHEQAKFEKGVPVGWRERATSEVFDVLSGGTPKTDVAAYWDGDIPFFTPKDAGDNFYVLDTEKHITANGLNSCNSRLYPKGTIFITARGTVGKLALANREMAMNQSCYALAPRMAGPTFFHFMAIKGAINYLKGVSKSGVFDNIIVDTFKTVPVLMAPESLIASFNKVVGPMFQQISGLMETNALLCKKRDALLPRLISGKLDIKLFRLDDKAVRELEGRSAAVEKSIQTLLEQHLEAFLGVRFLATEYVTGDLEITMKNPADFEKAQPLLRKSYEAS